MTPELKRSAAKRFRDGLGDQPVEFQLNGFAGFVGNVDAGFFGVGVQRICD
jgi:hypothetical protein